MSSENIGADKDLDLNAEVAENVVGGVKRKKAVRRKLIQKFSFLPGVSAPAPSEAEFEAQYDKDMVDHGLDPVYGKPAGDQNETG